MVSWKLKLRVSWEQKFRYIWSLDMLNRPKRAIEQDFEVDASREKKLREGEPDDDFCRTSLHGTHRWRELWGHH